ncbi:YbfB/YjiJ family MFS transporter [Histidinibacterium aquaticum]|uniref:YbfB/YjiJ family MFS transporter n=1 Tax=Histidinibacterium aquaticum TaxID=2613962 RepID=A0A5J5GLC1_9RHOB|nr:YbfB/YjiJ family MFS transporter [Histidinibacterium aquaticum]KAA9008324.1 YbfB/YjiJ family MFS transporter [Histidinibacterium aquaticum]
MDRLSIILTFFTGAVLTGGLAILALSLGWYSWWALGGAAAIGFLLSWPAAYPISRRIKRQDPFWDETRVDEVDGVLPDPTHREV